MTDRTTKDKRPDTPACVIEGMGRRHLESVRDSGTWFFDCRADCLIDAYEATGASCSLALLPYDMLKST